MGSYLPPPRRAHRLLEAFAPPANAFAALADDDSQTGHLTCHQALTKVLKWQWAKHKEFTEQEASPCPIPVGFAMCSINMSQLPIQD